MKTFNDLSLKTIYQDQHRALNRLQLWTTGQVYQIAETYHTDVQRQVRGIRALSRTKQSSLRTAASRMTAQYRRLLTFSLEQAAQIPFASLAVFHQNYFDGLREDIDISRQNVFQSQIQDLINQTANTRYQDGLDLNGRLRQLPKRSEEKVLRAIRLGLANGDDAVTIGRQLEQVVGHQPGAKRWVNRMLHQRGNVPSTYINEQGVVYDMLRLARNEINITYHTSIDLIFQQQPWVDKEKINLSPAHPKIDICDSITSGGEGGRGVYQVGSIQLPIHVNCMCYKTAVPISKSAFQKAMRDYRSGGRDRRGIGGYSRFLGLPSPDRLGLLDMLIIAALIAALLLWLSGDEEDLDNVDYE